MFRKLKAGRRGSSTQPAARNNNEPAPDQADDGVDEIEDHPEFTSSSPRDDEYVDSESAEAIAAAEEGTTRPPSAATVSPSVAGASPVAGMTSHPITPDPPSPMSPPDSAYNGSNPGSSRQGGASPGVARSSQQRSPPPPLPVSSSSPGSEFQTHLRKVTANLVDILDQMSNNGGSVTNSPPGSSQGKKFFFYLASAPSGS
jgi:hypothetical protein